jgi:hypothetical protein
VRPSYVSQGQLYLPPRQAREMFSAGEARRLEELSEQLRAGAPHGGGAAPPSGGSSDGNGGGGDGGGGGGDDLFPEEQAPAKRPRLDGLGVLHFAGLKTEHPAGAPAAPAAAPAAGAGAPCFACGGPVEYARQGVAAGGAEVELCNGCGVHWRRGNALPRLAPPPLPYWKSSRGG